MTTERRGLFVMRTDEDGAKCDAGCPHHDYLWSCEMPDDDDEPAGWRCRIYDEHGESGAKMDARHPKCVEAEQAAREAEVAAVKRGYDLRDEYDADDMDADLAPHALAHVIEHIRGGKR